MITTRTRTGFAACTLPVALVLSAARPASAQGYTYQNLATFSNSGTGGFDPRTPLTLLGNSLYGTTNEGGANNSGTIFSLPAAGGSVTPLASFGGSGGVMPSGLTLSADGQTFYGDTFGGSIFSVPVAGGPITTLGTLAGGDGSESGLTLSADGRTLYGNTIGTGSGNAGVVFSVPVGGGAVTTLATFNDTNGQSALGRLTLIGGTLYGTTGGGGAASDGTVFSVPVGGGAVTTLASFSGAKGSTPEAGLTLSADGTTFYGTTNLGGASSRGVVFSVPVGGGAITDLATFTGANGTNPGAGLVLSADGRTLFSTTDGNGRSDRGTVFSVPTAGGSVTTLVQFTGLNGSLPNGGLTLGPDGTLYGTTSLGGANFNGNVYALVPNAAPEPSQAAALTLGTLGLAGLTLRSHRRTLA